jgi:hypothetical protein
MNRENKSRTNEDGVQPGLKIKRLALQLTIGDNNLASEIKRAFDLAKSSGQELDLTFNPGNV